MIVSDKYKFVYIDIPKTASTSLDLFFTKYYAGKREVSDTRFLKHNRTIPDKAKNYLVIASVRNPYDRLISHFYHYIKYWKKGPPLTTLKEFIIHSNIVTKQTSSDCLDTYYYRFFPCWKYLEPLNCDIILKTETLEKDILKIPFIDKEIQLLYKNKLSYSKILDKECVSLITEWAGKDFEQFGYNIRNNS